MSNLSKILLSSIILNFSFSFNYIEDIQPIFNASCISCHNTTSENYSNHQLDLTSYSGIMAGGESGDVVIPFDASSSLLWEKITTYEMPPYGSGVDFLTEEQTNLIADWINDGALEEEEESEGDPENWDCQYDSDCMDDEFCSVECFIGGCGFDDSELSGMIGQYCQPCNECEYPEDAVSGNCDACGGTSDDCSDLDQSECESSDVCEWNDYDQSCENGEDGDGYPECMMDCEGIETVDPEVDANAFCEWYLVAYDDTTCLYDCDDEYYAGIMDEIYSMCEFCLVDYSCDEVWNSENCSDLDQSECESSDDCDWNEDDMMCEDIEINCTDMGQCECEFDFDCQWNEDDMMCEDITDDGPPECWQNCEGIEILEDPSGTEICNWFVPTFEDGICFEDCHDCGPEEMIYDVCQMCMQDDSCDDYFQDDDSCSDLDQTSCEYSEDCQWNDYDMSCEDTSGDDGGGDGPPECMMDCEGIDDIDPDEDATSFCIWYIPIYDDGTCLEDCEDDTNSELDAIYSMCQVCVTYGNCDDMWDDLEICADLDQSECEENTDCEWDNYDMMCEDAGDLNNELIVQGEYRISNVYPNPFNPTTTITYQVPHFASISIDVYNLNGQLIESLYKGYKKPGEYAINWNAGNVTSGVYLIKLASGSFIETQRVMLVK